MACVWTPIYRFPSNFDRASGPRGEAGTAWLFGASPPSASQGRVGDFYLQTNGDVWTKQANAFGIPPSWARQGNIRGATGAPGAKGDPGQPAFGGGGGGSSSSPSTPVDDEPLISGHVNMRV